METGALTTEERRLADRLSREKYAGYEWLTARV
jgi:hypothetical protein